MLRVNHAGEYGAVRIYAGQRAILHKHPIAATLQTMQAQEQQHLDTFNQLLPEHRVRPTALLPLWHIAGFALGAGTALLGEKAAHACTMAVEEVITEHYQQHIDQLDSQPPLQQLFTRLRDEEQEHYDHAATEGGATLPAYRLLRAVIRTGSKLAIGLSQRL